MFGLQEEWISLTKISAQFLSIYFQENPAISIYLTHMYWEQASFTRPQFSTENEARLCIQCSHSQMCHLHCRVTAMHHRNIPHTKIILYRRSLGTSVSFCKLGSPRADSLALIQTFSVNKVSLHARFAPVKNTTGGYFTLEYLHPQTQVVLLWKQFLPK
jgi:hypothetical protein